jgi:tape measure domain-containing protein
LPKAGHGTGCQGDDATKKGRLIMKVTDLVAMLGFKVDQGSLKAATASVQTFAKDTSSIFDGLGRKIAGATALWFAGAELSKITQYTASIEMLRTQFEVMLGSASQASSFMKDILNVAFVTPFEAKDLADGARLMLQFGASIENTIPYMMALGDITLGDKNRFNQMNLAFSQMLAAGKLMGQDLLQMTTAGYNPLKSIAEMQKKPYQDMLDMMHRGLVTPKMVIDAMIRDTGEGGRFFKGMEKGSKTIAGLWSSLKDAFNLIRLEIGTMFEKPLKDMIQMGITIVSSVKPAAAEIGKAMGEVMSRVSNSLKMFGGLVEQIGGNTKNSFIAVIKLVGQGVTWLTESFMKLYWAVYPLLSLYTQLQKALADSVSLANDGASAFDTFAVTLRTFSEMIAKALGIMIFLLSETISFFAALSDTILNLVNSILPVTITKTHLLVGLFAVLGSMATISGVIALSAAFVKLTAAIKSAAIAQGILTALTNPVALGAIALGAGAALGITLADMTPGSAHYKEGQADKNKDLQKKYEDADKAYWSYRGGDSSELKRLANERDSAKSALDKGLAYEGSTGGPDTGLTEWMANIKKGINTSSLDDLMKNIKNINTKIENNFNIETQITDDGKTKLTPEGIQDMMDRASRSLFNIQISKAINSTL